MDPIDEERSAENELPTMLEQTKLLLHGVLRRQAEKSPVAKEEPNRYFLKGDNYKILFLNMISWISYILMFTAPGAFWVPTATQIAATAVMTVWEAINDDFPEDLSDQDSSFDEETLQMIKSLREKYPKFAEVVMEMNSLYRHPNNKRLTKKEQQFLKLLYKLKQKMQDSIVLRAAKMAKTDENFHIDSLGNLHKIKHDDEVQKAMEGFDEVPAWKVNQFKKKVRGPVAQHEIYSMDAFIEANPDVTNVKDKKFMQQLFKAVQKFSTASQTNAGFKLGGPTPISMKCALKVLKMVHKNPDQRNTVTDWPSLIGRLDAGFFKVDLMEHTITHDGQSYQVMVLQGGNHGALLLLFTETYESVVNNETGTIINMPRCALDKIFDGLAYISVGFGSPERVSEILEAERKALPQPPAPSFFGNERVIHLFKSVFDDVPKTLYMLNYEVLMESSDRALPRQQELLFLNTRKVFPNRLGKENLTGKEIVHVFMAQFLTRDCSTESIMKPQSAIDEIDIRKGFVAAVWAVAWIVLPIEVFPVMWSENLPDLQELQGKTIEADVVNKVLKILASCIYALNNSDVERKKNDKNGEILLCLVLLVVVSDASGEKEISTLLEFCTRMIDANLKPEEQRICRNLKILRSTWQQHAQGASRNPVTTEMSTSRGRYQALANKLLGKDMSDTAETDVGASGGE